MSLQRASLSDWLWFYENVGIRISKRDCGTVVIRKTLYPNSLKVTKLIWVPFNLRRKSKPIRLSSADQFVTNLYLEHVQHPRATFQLDPDHSIYGHSLGQFYIRSQKWKAHIYLSFISHARATSGTQVWFYHTWMTNGTTEAMYYFQPIKRYQEAVSQKFNWMWLTETEPHCL